MVEVEGSGGVDRIPDGDGDPEKALTGDQPIPVQPLDPVAVTDSHEVGDPVQLLAPLEQPLAQLVIPPAVADVPLAAGDDLERALALLIELDQMGDGAGLAVEVARFRQQLYHTGVSARLC